jgi:hypothetical protein
MTAPEAAFDGSPAIRGSKSSQVAYSEQISILLTLNETIGPGNRPRPVSGKPDTFLEVTDAQDCAGQRMLPHRSKQPDAPLPGLRMRRA